MLYVYVKELLYHKKSLKYQSEAVNRRITDNTMTKRTKNTEGQTTIYKAQHRKLKKLLSTIVQLYRGVSFIGGGNQRNPPTCRKSLTNFIT
jgi:fructose-bisphosphate aldolase class 1